MTVQLDTDETLVGVTLAEVGAPVLVISVELNSDEDHDVDVRDYSAVWCLYRHSGTPGGIRLWNMNERDSVRLGTLRRAGIDVKRPETPALGDRPIQRSVTVVICTRNRTPDLTRALESLKEQSDPSFDVIIVDNVEVPGDTRDAIRSFDGLNIRYVHESRPGLSVARNTGLRHVTADLVAWLDDDERADREWIATLREGFGHPSEPLAVTGYMAPAQLETRAQLLFEQYGGFNKGRGLTPAVLRTGLPSVPDALLPLPNFGAGGNMAFDTRALRELGNFDTSLGAGTLTHGGEETRAFSLLLMRGDAILYWPRAITWHYHRLTVAQLERVFYGYSAGLSAYYVSMVRHSPRVLLNIVRIVPIGIKEVLSQRGSERNAELPAEFPSRLLSLSRRGLALGAILYLRQWTRDIRSRRAF